MRKFVFVSPLPPRDDSIVPRATLIDFIMDDGIVLLVVFLLELCLYQKKASCFIYRSPDLSKPSIPCWMIIS